MILLFRGAVLALGSCLLSTIATAAELLPAERSIAQVIDHYVQEKLVAAGVSAVPLADDPTLLRRKTLDLVGRIPTVAEAKEFVASQDPDKREKLIERLISSPAFVRHQVNQFDTLLMYGTGGNVREYLQAALQENRSWDRIFRELVLAEDADQAGKGATKFLRQRIIDQDKLTADVSSIFFGVNISCAQCHDHPLVADWKQDHFFGMKSFFSRTYELGDFVGEKDYGLVNFKTTAGEAKTAKLMFLTGAVIDEPDSAEPGEKEKKEEKQRLDELKKNKQRPPEPKFSRRAKLVDAALAPADKNYLARSIVNQMWNRYFGRGLVMPLDQMHAENKPSHPELLDWLARDLVAHGYDLRRLSRGIVASDAYARGGVWNSGERPLPELFAVAVPRPLTPPQYGTSLRLGSTNADQIPAGLNAEEFEKRIQGVEAAGRGIGGDIEQPNEDYQVSVDEALLFSNSAKMERELLRDGKDSLVSQLKELKDPRELIETATWTIFSRPPHADEIVLLERFLSSRADRQSDAIRQMVWAMLTSTECRFNH